MATEISGKLPYEPLEPIKIEQEPCPILCKTCSVFFNALALTLMGIGAGLAIATLATATLLTGGLVGGVAGLVVGIALSIFQKRTSVEAKYRIQTMDQLEKTQSASRILEAINKIRALVRENKITFEQAGDNHALHAEVTLVTDSLQGARPDIKKVWKTFLERIHGHICSYPAGLDIPLDFTFELNRLDGEYGAYAIEALDASNRADLERVVELEREFFGEGCVFPGSRIAKEMIHGYVARSTKDRSIIGFVWTAKTNKDPAKQSVMGLGRSPGACRLAIGESLMRQLIESHPKVELTLQVRESNTPAKLLYEKLGFEWIKGVKGYYSYPTEDAINMKLNRAQYQPLPVEDVV